MGKLYRHLAAGKTTCRYMWCDCHDRILPGLHCSACSTSPRDVSCPLCFASAGRPCRTLTTNRATEFHAQRRRRADPDVIPWHAVILDEYGTTRKGKR